MPLSINKKSKIEITIPKWKQYCTYVTIEFDVTKLNFIWHCHDDDLDPRRKKMICFVIISFWVCTCWRHIFLLLLQLNWPGWRYIHWPHVLLFIYLYIFWLSVIQRGLFAAPIKIKDDWICWKKIFMYYYYICTYVVVKFKHPKHR